MESKEYRVTLDHGDLYVMSEKAVGEDWKKSASLTLRHCAGAEKYLKLPKKHMQTYEAVDDDLEVKSVSSGESIFKSASSKRK